MRLTIRWVLIATLALTACEASDDVTATDTTPEVTQTTATPTTRLVDSDDDAPTTTESTVTPEAGATITIDNFSFGSSPTVGVGDPLTVVNDDGVTHTWTSDDDVFDSGALGSGDSFEYAFEEAGEYSFFCEIHPGMTGTITVTG